MTGLQPIESRSISIATDLASVRQLRKACGLPVHSSADTSEELFETTINQRSDVEGPFVVAVPEASLGATVAFCRIERWSAELKVGFRRFRLFRGRALVLVEDGLQGPSTARRVDTTLAALRDELDRDHLDVLMVLGVRVGSELQRQLLLQRGRGPCILGEKFLNRYADVNRTFEEFTAGKHAKSIRQAVNRFRRLGERLQVERFDVGGDPEVLRSRLNTIARGTRSAHLDFGYQDDPLHRSFCEEGIQNGWYRVWVALVDGEPASFWSAFTLGAEWTLHETGFVAEYADDAVGTGLLGELVREACGDPTVRTINFGRGDAPYKRVWATSVTERRDILLFRSSPKWRTYAYLEAMAENLRLATTRLLGEQRVRRVRAWVISRGSDR